jgi:hypothetical protein
MDHATAPVGLVIAWRRDVPDYAFMEDCSLQHIVRQVDESAHDYALCGAKIRWLYITPGDSRRCQRCFTAATKAGMVNEHGDALTDY